MTQSNTWNSAANALGAVRLIDFEPPAFNDTQATYSTLNLGQGVSAFTNSGAGSSAFSIYSNFQNEGDGFNTTLGGDVRLRTQGQTNFGFEFVLTFEKPITAFGAYVTGQGNSSSVNPFSFDFSDGTNQSLSLNGVHSGARFVGFTAPDKAVNRVTITSTNFVFGNPLATFSIDDIRWVEAVPEPNQILWTVASVPMFLIIRREKQRGLQQ